MLLTMGLDVERIREDFPTLKRLVKGRRLVYLDNAASSLKPRQVIEAIAEFYREHYANIHRGLHTLSEEASQMYEESRDEIARFIGASREEIVFVRNATEAINLVALSWAYWNLEEGDEIVISVMEHHSNIVPWILLSKRKKVRIKVARITPEGLLDLDHLSLLIGERTRIVSLVHVSNVLGTVNPARQLAKMAHEVGALFLLDGAQSVPHMPVNVKELDCDFLAFSGHKMLGPTGIGVLYGKKEVLEEMEPLYGGGEMISEVHCSEDGCTASWAPLPLKFEAGTPHIVGAIGLAAAIRYLKSVGMENIVSHEKILVERALELLGEVPGLRVVGPLDPDKRSGLVSFTVKGLSPHEVAALLDANYGIAVRSGYHCAQPLHEFLGLKEGTVRASFYLYNTVEEVEYLAKALSEVSALA